MRKFAVLIAALIFIAAQNSNADTLTFRKLRDYKCTTWICGIYEGGQVEVGSVTRNGKYAGSYRKYTSRDGKKTKTDVSIREGG